MDYLEFLGQWYNLVFLALAAVGLAVGAAGRVRRRDRFAPAVSLVAAAVLGLTWNGVIHDLSLGSAARRFPLVLLASVGFGVVFSRWAVRIRDRHFRPIEAVAFNRPGHVGVEARIVTRRAGPVPGSGRAQWQDEQGTLHVVHVHTEGDGLGFGRRVRLAEFDEQGESYLVQPL